MHLHQRELCCSTLRMHSHNTRARRHCGFQRLWYARQLPSVRCKAAGAVDGGRGGDAGTRRRRAGCCAWLVHSGLPAAHERTGSGCGAPGDAIGSGHAVLRTTIAGSATAGVRLLLVLHQMRAAVVAS